MRMHWRSFLPSISHWRLYFYENSLEINFTIDFSLIIILRWECIGDHFYHRSLIDNYSSMRRHCWSFWPYISHWQLFFYENLFVIIFTIDFSWTIILIWECIGDHFYHRFLIDNYSSMRIHLWSFLP